MTPTEKIAHAEKALALVATGSDAFKRSAAALILDRTGLTP